MQLVSKHGQRVLHESWATAIIAFAVALSMIGYVGLEIFKQYKATPSVTVPLGAHNARLKQDTVVEPSRAVLTPSRSGDMLQQK